MPGSQINDTLVDRNLQLDEVELVEDERLNT